MSHLNDYKCMLNSTLLMNFDYIKTLYYLTHIFFDIYIYKLQIHTIQYH